MVSLCFALRFSTESDRVATQQTWQAFGDRLLSLADEQVRVRSYDVPWVIGAISLEHLLSRLRERGISAPPPAVVVVPVFVGDRRVNMRAQVAVVGAGRPGEWMNAEELWSVIARALLSADLDIGNCANESCFFHYVRPGRDPLVPPSQICPACMESVPEDRRPGLRRVHDWLKRNTAQGVRVEDLACTSPKRFAELSSASRDDTLKVDTSTVLAYAEEVLHEPLPNDVRQAGAQVASRTYQRWSAIPEPFRTALTTLSSRVADLDALSYLTSKRHREHSEHVANTGLLAYLLLDSQLPSGHTVRDQTAVSAGVPDEIDHVPGAMWAAAMWHDAGYTVNRYLEIVSRTASHSQAVHMHLFELCEPLFQGSSVPLDRLKGIARPAGRSVLDVAADEAEALLREHFEGTPRWPWSQRFLEHCRASDDSLWDVLNHGVWSLWVLHWALEAAGQSSATVKDNLLWQLACEAILFHDMPPKHYVTDAHHLVPFDENPLLVMLKLTDVAQDWDRWVFGRAGMVRELDSVGLRGVEWRLRPPAQLRGDLTLVLEYQRAQDLLDVEWQYATAVRGLAGRLSPLRFPDRGEWAGGPTRVSFQIQSPPYSPEIAGRIVGS